MRQNRPRIEYNSRGETGNTFWLLCRLLQEMRKQRRIAEYNDIRNRVVNANSYAEALEIMSEVADLIDTAK